MRPSFNVSIKAAYQASAAAAPHLKAEEGRHELVPQQLCEFGDRNLKAVGSPLLQGAQQPPLAAVAAAGAVRSKGVLHRWKGTGGKEEERQSGTGVGQWDD